jgi:hypothetical protein
LKKEVCKTRLYFGADELRRRTNFGSCYPINAIGYTDIFQQTSHQIPYQLYMFRSLEIIVVGWVDQGEKT